MTDKQAKHTPGPWTYVNNSMDPAAPCIRSSQRCPDTGELIDVLSLIGAMGGDDSEADARLIAAAPDLLAVAEAVATHFEGTDAPLGAMARAALAKARPEAR